MSIREKFEDSIYEAVRKRYQKLKRWQKTAAKWLLGLTVASFLFINYALPPIRDQWASRCSPFPEGVAGILVLRIEGDDEKNSLQRDLVSTLNTELSKEAPGQQIEVRAYGGNVFEAAGLTHAHAEARMLGKKCKAILVVWGNRVDERKFHPRLTIVDDQHRVVMTGERALGVQSLIELSLPTELVNQPIFLTHFAIGYSFYHRKNDAVALFHFNAALKRPIANPIDMADIRYYAGICHWALAKGQKESAWHLKRAIAYFDTVLSIYTEQQFPTQWAKIQNNLGVAYAELSIGNRKVNLLKAITAYEAASRVRTEKDFPVEWALTQSNLGNAYFFLPASDRKESLQKSILAHESALRVFTEKSYPLDWAVIRNNLGLSYWSLPTGDHDANLEKAINHFQAALRVLSEDQFPLSWAMVEHNLGNAYSDLSVLNNDSNLQITAIAAYESALRVRTEKSYPSMWAETLNSLANAHADLKSGRHDLNLQKAISLYEAALRVHTRNDFPAEWAQLQNNLGTVYAELSIGDINENLQKAITAYLLALEIYTENDFPYYWANTQNGLGEAYLKLGARNYNITNLRKAIKCFTQSLTVLTGEAYPDDYEIANSNLKKAQVELQKLLQRESPQ